MDVRIKFSRYEVFERDIVLIYEGELASFFSNLLAVQTPASGK